MHLIEPEDGRLTGEGSRTRSIQSFHWVSFRSSCQVATRDQKTKILVFSMFCLNPTLRRRLIKPCSVQGRTFWKGRKRTIFQMAGVRL